MAELIRRADFSSSPLGPPDRWPQSLRTALSICLSSRFPMIIYWGPQLCVLYNDAYIPIFARKHPDMLGKPAHEAWSEIWDVLAPMYEAVMQGGEATWSEDQLLVLERNGFPEESYFTWSFSPIADESGSVGGVFTAVFETTARVLGERRLLTLRELGSQVATAESVDATCRAAVETLGKNRHDLPFALLYLLDGDGTLRLAAQSGLDGLDDAAPSVIAAGEPATWPVGPALRDQRPHIVHPLPASLPRLPGGPWPEAARRAVVVPLGGGEGEQPGGALVLGISPRLELDPAYEDFLQLVGNHVKSALNSAHSHEEERRRAEALAEIDRAKTAFFSNVSHELRTPLTLLLAPVEDALAGSAALAANDLEVVHRNALRLLKLVNALLDFSRIEAGRAHAVYRPVDLARATREVAAAFEPAMTRAGLSFTVECEPLPEPVHVDVELWERIVLNLLSNALKFTFDGGVRLTLRPTDGGIELAVADTGTGIAAAELPRLFERFHRIEGARSRTHEGTGIGLALVQELVRLHGGTIEAESEVGRGTTLRVRLPFGTAHLPADRIAQPANEEEATAGIEAIAFASEAEQWLRREPGPLPAGEEDGGVARSAAHVLVVDDNADMRDYIARTLRARWRVTTAADGEEALERIAGDRPDLVVSDVMMPLLDGTELLRRIRGSDDTAALPVILVSARAGEEARIEGIEAGADDYLVKPFGARELVARVHTHLELSRLRAAALELSRAHEQQVRELFGREQEARGLAESASRAKDEFLAMLGHELRNPLSPILTALQLMRLRGDDSVLRERAIIERQVAHLVRLVDDLLDVSRIARGKVNLNREPVELADAIAKGIELASPLIEERSHRLSVDVPRGLVVHGDVIRLAQVTANLLTNSARYTPPGGNIVVTARRGGGEVLLRVRDDGVGIAPEILERVFDLFVQERQAPHAGAGGLGLGLAIVRSLVQLHGGQVSAHSSGPGRGTEVLVRLPLLAEADASSQASSPHFRVSHPGAHRVLVVDDNRDAADLLVESLKAMGHLALAAYDGPTAIAVAATYQPEVALLDIGLPVMDGHELAARLRELPGLERLPLVAITGYGQEHDRRRSAAAGFDDHLVKPIALERVSAVIDTLVGHPARTAPAASELDA